MDYFDVFPRVLVNGIEVVDISRAVTHRNDLTKYLMNYVVPEGQSANDVAYNLYGQDELYWLVYLVNPGYIFNEFLSTTEFQTYINDNFNVTALQFSHSLNLLPPINSPVGIKVYLASDTNNENELPIKEINVYRRQIILDKLYNEPVKVYYTFNGQIVRVEDYDLIRIYLDINYIDDDYIAYDENGIPPFYFFKSVYQNLTRHYTYNGIAYDRYPDGIDELLVTPYTYYEYEAALNEYKRNIQVIRPEFKNDALSIITDFAEALNNG
jgi:hypothetical protein